MAEAFANAHGKGEVEAYSAGSRPNRLHRINPKTIRLMRQIGYDLSEARSKAFSMLPPGSFEAVVLMGCGDIPPDFASAIREEWNIPDPGDLSSEEAARIRDVIEHKVIRLINRMANGQNELG